LKLKSRRGAKKFKRHVLGFFGTTKIKDQEEMVSLLCSSGMVLSKNEGREVLPMLDEKVEYSSHCLVIKVQKYKNDYRETKYKIQAWDDLPDI